MEAYGKAIRNRLALLLPRLWHQPTDGSEYTGWRINGVVAVQLTLSLPPAVVALEEALAVLGAALEDVQMALLAMAAHAYSFLGNTGCCRGSMTTPPAGGSNSARP